MEKQPLTPDSAELTILTELCNRGGMMAIPMSPYPDIVLQMAHERLIKAEQIRLADLAVVPGQRGNAEPARIIAITAAGRSRRMNLLVGIK